MFVKLQRPPPLILLGGFHFSTMEGSFNRAPLKGTIGVYITFGGLQGLGCEFKSYGFDFIFGFRI